jgi:hypothetical protein
MAAWWQSPVGRDYGQGFVDFDTDGGREGKRQMFQPGTSGADLALVEATHLLGAEPYWVSEDMLALAWHAADSYPGTTLAEAHLPTPTGFCYLAAPLRAQDVHGKVVTSRLITWTSGLGLVDRKATLGVITSWYSSYDDLAYDESLAEYATGQDDAARYPAGLMLMHSAFWPYGRPWAPTHLGRILEDVEPSGVRWNYWKVLASMWAMMQQRLAHTVHVPHRRHARRRALRAGQDELAGHGVRVITLRRETSPLEASETPAQRRHVDWASRWVVRGHWRDQPYGDGSHRWIFIDPYIKGPEDKPLRFAAHVYKWTR